MLDLRPDAELRRVKGIALQPIARHTHPAEVVLVQCDRRAGESKVPGLQAGLREGNVTAHTLCLPLGKIERDHVQDTLRNLRVLPLDVGFHLLCRSHSGSHDLGIAAGFRRGTAVHRRFNRLTEGIHRVAHTKLCPEMLRVAVVGSDAPAVSLPVADDHAVCGRVQAVLLTQHGKQFYGRFISALRHSLCRCGIGAGKIRPACVLDTGRLAHLHADVGVVAIGRVSAEQDGEKLFFEKVEGLTSPIDYATLRGCPELERMEYFQNPQGSLFKLTRGEYDFILDMIREENPVTSEASIDAYTKSDFLDEVYMTEKRYESLVAVLRNKKNIILQGAPGVGKTFAARRLAWSMMGEKDDGRIEFVQFHQNYSYEDFMMGYKPVEDGFELKYGIFYRFCQKAANQPDKEFFFIIDEINRGNMSKIFGELLMLIEKDYRGTKATLAYNGLSFSVPKNLYIIGMMNTADRSLAMIDYALRRRFSFFEVEPGFDSEGFIQYQNDLNNETLNELVSKVKDLNREISLDKSLGKGFCIGHSYFCGRDVCTEEWLHSIVDYDILPMLSEYWFDDVGKLQRWENILQGVFQ